MESYILKAINHIKYVSKKKHSAIKIFNYLQNNGASQYTYDQNEEDVSMLKDKVKYLELENKLLKSDNSIKQSLIQF